MKDFVEFLWGCAYTVFCLAVGYTLASAAYTQAPLRCFGW